MLSSCVILGKSPHFPEPQFPCLYSEGMSCDALVRTEGNATRMVPAVPSSLHGPCGQVLGTEKPGWGHMQGGRGSCLDL